MKIVVLNGWSASSGLLGAFPERLAENHEVMVLDHPYQHSANELNKQLDELLTADTVLLGWSLGGMLALRYLLAKRALSKQPAALVLLQSTPCFIQKADWPYGVSEDAFSALAKLVEAQQAAKLIRHFSHLMLAGSAELTNDRRLVRKNYQAEALPDWQILTEGLQTLREFDCRSSLSQLTLPVLGLFGDNDVLIKREVETAFRQQCSQFTAHNLPGIGHFPFGSQVEPVVSRIEQFLRSDSITESIKSRIDECH